MYNGVNTLFNNMELPPIFNQEMKNAKRAADGHFLHILGKGWKLLGKATISSIENAKNRFFYKAKFQNGPKIASVSTTVYKPPYPGSVHNFEDNPIHFNE